MMEELEGFATGSIDGSKVYDGTVFPLTYFPSDPSSPRDLPSLISTHREALASALSVHGALLFRGFPIHTPESFSSAVSSFGWPEHTFPLSANRVAVAPRVYSSTEYPLHVYINFHHEMSMFKEPCAKILFACLVAPPEGGETSVVRSDVVVERMDREAPGAVRKFEEVGMLSRVRHKTVYEDADGAEGVDKAWMQLFKTRDEEEAKKRAIEKMRCSAVHLFPDGSCELEYGPFNPVRELGGRRVWFNNILPYDTREKEASVWYGDGEPLLSEVTDKYDRILLEECVDVKWKVGDVMVVDNTRCQHARRPGKPPRRVVVSLCK